MRATRDMWIPGAFASKGNHMPKSRFTEAQIVGILKEAKRGAKATGLYRKHGMSAATLCKWRATFL